MKRGKTLALQTFSEIGEGIVEIDHTEVDGSLQGQGIAGRMTELAVVYLKNQGKKSYLPALMWRVGLK